jgi:hypothetical protein
MDSQKRISNKDEDEGFNAFSFTHLIDQINHALSLQSSAVNTGPKNKSSIPVHVLSMMNVLDGNDAAELMSVLEANHVMDLIKYHNDGAPSSLVGYEVEPDTKELSSPSVEDISLSVNFPDQFDEPRFNPEPVYIDAAGNERLGIMENPDWHWIRRLLHAHVDENNETQITPLLTASVIEEISPQSPSRLSQANFQSSKVQKPRWQKVDKIYEKRVAELAQRVWETNSEKKKPETPSRPGTSCCPLSPTSGLLSDMLGDYLA